MLSNNTCAACRPDPECDAASPPSRRGVVLLAPDDLIWAGVRSLLRSLPNVRVLGDISVPEDLQRAPLPELPEVAISALRIGSESTLPLLQELYRRAPAIRFLLLIDGRQDMELSGYAALSGLSCLCWNDLKPEALRHCLEAALAAPLAMFSACIREAGMASPSRSGFVADRRAPRLSPRALTVLSALADGHTQQGVATATGLSPRTVQRTIAALQEELDASSLFALGSAAERLGLLAPPPPGSTEQPEG